jgi:hypothetical protein
LVEGKAATVETIFLQVGGLHIAAEVPAIDFRRLALATDDPARAAGSGWISKEPCHDEACARSEDRDYC